MDNRPSSLTENLRRVYNAVEAFFDRQASLTEARLERPGGSQNKPLTARAAFAICLPLAKEFDRGARLKLIVAPDGAIEPDGASMRWEFFFDLPKRRGQMNCTWFLTWDESADDFGASRIEATVKPFPPEDSLLRRMVKDGQLLYSQLKGLWREERQRKPDLPHRFRDSDEVMQEFAHKGLDLSHTEVTLVAECKQGERPLWVAQGRDASLRARFER